MFDAVENVFSKGHSHSSGDGASSLFMPHISDETDFALERDSNGKIADFRKMSSTGVC